MWCSRNIGRAEEAKLRNLGGHRSGQDVESPMNKFKAGRSREKYYLIVLLRDGMEVHAAPSWSQYSRGTCTSAEKDDEGGRLEQCNTVHVHV